MIRCIPNLGTESSSFTFGHEFNVDSLARTIAKIAHSSAVRSLGCDNFVHWLPPYILGKDECLSYVVGGADMPQNPVKQMHEVISEVWPTEKDFLVTTKIRLFAPFGEPFATVIVGTHAGEARRP